MKTADKATDVEYLGIPFSTEIVHLSFKLPFELDRPTGCVLHAKVSSDGWRAECLETGDEANGTDRDDTLNNLIKEMRANHFNTAGSVGYWQFPKSKLGADSL